MYESDWNIRGAAMEVFVRECHFECHRDEKI